MSSDLALTPCHGLLYFFFVVLEGFGLADWSISGNVKALMGSMNLMTTNHLCLMFN
jgi:hypothetical protein